MGAADGEGFSLSLPVLPGLDLRYAFARIQIYAGVVKPPVPPCSGFAGKVDNSPGVIVPAPGASSDLSDTQYKAPMPTVESSDAPIASPVFQIVADLTEPYRPNSKFGPVKLPDGAYTVVFTVHRSQAEVIPLGAPSKMPPVPSTLLRYAITPFKVSSASVSEIPLLLRRPEHCGGAHGGVIFRPIDERKHPPTPSPQPEPNPGPFQPSTP
jgi:hypothetical protein